MLALDADARKPTDELSETSEEKESVRWFDGLAAAQERASVRCRVVNVCEADILFKTQAAAPDGAGLLVRANWGLQHRVAQGEAKTGLWEGEDLSLRGAHGAGAWRTTRARETHRCAGSLYAHPHGETLEATAVSATNRRRDGQALDAAVQRGRSHGGERAAHSRLVRTEVGRVLPHPQDPGDRSFDEVGDCCLAFDAAWKVLDRLAREKPDTPEALSRDEALYLLLIHQRIIPKRPLKPPRRDARLVGFWPTKRQPLPGNEKL